MAEDTAPPDPATTAANLQKLQAEARKATADADKAETEAASARRDLKQGVLPNSGKSTSIAVKDGAGQIEAGLLASRELADLTATVATDANALFQAGCKGKTCARRKVIVLSATDDLTLPHRAVYDLRKTLVKRALDNAIQSFRTTVPPKPKPGTAAGFGVAAASAVVQLANLASYFATSNEVGSVSVTPNDQAMLGALTDNLRRACQLNEVYLASRVGTLTSLKTVTDDLKALDDLAYDAALKLATAKTHAATLRDGKKGDAANAAAKPWDDVASNLTEALEGYQAFTVTLADEKGAMPLSAVLREEGLAQLLTSDDETFAIVPTYVAAGGGYYTQTSLWTVVGGAVPFHVSGGSALSYVVFRTSDGRALGGGTVEGGSSYTKVKDVSARLRQAKVYSTSASGDCAASQAPAAPARPVT